MTAPAVRPSGFTRDGRQPRLVTTGPRDLALIEDAARMLAEARSLDDIRDIKSLAVAAQAYARKNGLGLDAQNNAGAIAIEAGIRLGEVLAEMRENDARASRGGDRGGERTSQNGTFDPPTLADLGISRRESAQAQALAASADEVRESVARSRAGRRPVTLGRAERVARDVKARRDRGERLGAPITQPAACDLRRGDFRTVLADLPDHSVDLILTDPPSPDAYLPLWSELGGFAKAKLAPHGVLATMSGHAHLPEVMARLGEHLHYRWIIAYLTRGSAARIHARNVTVGWKPVLVYGSLARWFHDVARSDGPDKAFHISGQSVSGMADLLGKLADPGQIICDPFAGGGTTAVVALAEGCSFVDAEIDQAVIESAWRRLAA